MTRLALLALCAALGACISRPKPDVVARPAPDPAGIGGTYCFRSPTQNVRGAKEIAARKYWQDQERKRPGTIRSLQTGWFSGIRLRDVADSSLLELIIADTVLTVHFTDRLTGFRRSARLHITRTTGGTTDGSPAGEVHIDLPKPRGGASLGIGTSKRWMTLTRGADSTLTYIEWYRERALAFFVLPMDETTARSVVFEPAASCA